MKINLFIGGSFDDFGGKKSGFISKITNSENKPQDLFVINGGQYNTLVPLLESFGNDIGTLFWFCDVPNDKPKIVNDILKKFPQIKLVISKNNRQGKYSKKDLMERIVKSNSIMLFEFTNEENKIGTSILTSKGDYLITKSTDPNQVYNEIVKIVK